MKKYFSTFSRQAVQLYLLILTVLFILSLGFCFLVYHKYYKSIHEAKIAEGRLTDFYPTNLMRLESGYDDLSCMVLEVDETLHIALPHRFYEKYYERIDSLIKDKILLNARVYLDSTLSQTYYDAKEEDTAFYYRYPVKVELGELYLQFEKSEMSMAEMSVALANGDSSILTGEIKTRFRNVIPESNDDARYHTMAYTFLVIPAGLFIFILIGLWNYLRKNYDLKTEESDYKDLSSLGIVGFFVFPAVAYAVYGVFNNALYVAGRHGRGGTLHGLSVWFVLLATLCLLLLLVLRYLVRDQQAPGNRILFKMLPLFAVLLGLMSLVWEFIHQMDGTD